MAAVGNILDVNHAPSLRHWTKIDAKPCSAMHHRTAISLSCKSGAEKHTPRTARQLSDSAYQENAALRFWAGQYNLKHGRRAGHVPRFHEARHRAGAGKC